MIQNPHDNRLDRERILAAAGLPAAAFALELRDECPSTNTALLEAAAGVPGVMRLLACERQSAGRGRRGRSWLSWGEGSLTFSVRWEFAPGAAAPAGLSLAAGVAVARALEGCGARGIALKWPNDVLYREGKLGGILTELATGASGAMSAVVGIGLNLRCDSRLPIDVPAAALADAVSQLPDRNHVLGRLAAELHAMLETFSLRGFAAFRDAWAGRNHHAGLPVRISGEQGAAREGLCIGVDDDGALLIDERGRRSRVLSGDVSLRSA